MLRLIPRFLLLPVGLIALCLPSQVRGQIFTRATHETGVTSNASCGPSSCVPQALTYGYYTEHWRRWPGEPSSPLNTESLSPFARPNRDVPGTQLPDPRDENSLAPRSRRSAGAEAGKALPPAQTAPPTAPQVSPSPAQATPPPDRNEPSGLPDALPADSSDLFDPPSEPSEPSDDGGFFPSAEPEQADAFPESFPESNPGSTLPPAELEDDSFDSGFDQEPSEDNADDVFDLDDFSRVDPRRLYRYRMSSQGRMRRPGATRPRTMPRTSESRRHPVQLAAYRRAENGRHNPLRRERQPVAQVDYALYGQPMSWETKPIEVAPTRRRQQPLQWAQPIDSRAFGSQTVEPARTGRTNPLR